MSFRTLSAIVRGIWLIHPGYVQVHLPLIAGVITGQSSGAELFSGSAEFEKPYVYNNGKKYDAYKMVYKPGVGIQQVLNSDEWPANSTGVIPLIGPVMKYNGDCGEPGMVQRSGWVNDFANSDKISKLVSWIDSPGGQADGTPQYADLIKNVDKPKTAYVDGGAFSAGAWVASAHDDIILSNPFADFGSVGAYTTFVDYTDFFKSKGINVKEVYAKQSTEKNDAYRKAQKGDLSGYEQSATECAAYFIESFAGNRGDKLKDSAWNTGAVFGAKEALDMGLIDGIGAFADHAMFSPKTQVIVNPSNTNHMKFTNLSALSKVENPTDEQIDQANANLTTEGITSVTIVRESFIQEAADATKNASELQTKLETQVKETAAKAKDLAEANAKNDDQAKKIKELEEKVEAFGKNAGAKHTEQRGDDTPPEGPEQDAQSVLDNLPHNKKADQMGFGK